MTIRDLIKNRKRKVFLSHNDPKVSTMFLNKGFNTTYVMDGSCDLACFVDGPTIHPYLYGCLPYNSECIYDLNRDMREVELFKNISSPYMPKVGIGRGAQLLNVLSGGSLYQECDGHTHPHMAAPLYDANGTPFLVSSNHHNQMIPGPSSNVFFVANQSTSKRTRNYRDVFVTQKVIPEDNKDIVYDWDDVEGIHYDHNNTLCYQPNPEYAGLSKCNDYFFSCLEEHCFPIHDNFLERMATMKEKKGA